MILPGYGIRACVRHGRSCMYRERANVSGFLMVVVFNSRFVLIKYHGMALPAIFYSSMMIISFAGCPCPALTSLKRALPVCSSIRITLDNGSFLAICPV